MSTVTGSIGVQDQIQGVKVYRYRYRKSRSTWTESQGVQVQGVMEYREL